MNCTEKRNVGDKTTCWHSVVQFLLLTSQLQIISCSSHTKIDGDSSSLLFVNVGEKTNVVIPIPKNLQDIAECHLIQVFRMKDNPHADLTRISCSLPQVNITNKCLCDLTTHSTLNVRINNIEYKDGGRWLVNVSTSTEQKSFNFYLDVMAGMQAIDRFLPVFALLVSVWLFLLVAFIPLFAFKYSRLRSPKPGLSKIEGKSADVVVQMEPSAACQNEEKILSNDKDSGDKPMTNLFRQESNVDIVFVMPAPASPCPTRLAFPLDREILGSPRLQLHSDTHLGKGCNPRENDASYLHPISPKIEHADFISRERHRHNIFGMKFETPYQTPTTPVLKRLIEYDRQTSVDHCRGSVDSCGYIVLK